MAINKAEAQPRTTSDGGALLLPPFHHFGFLILPSFTFPQSLIVTLASSSFHFPSSDVSSRFPPPANLKEKMRDRGKLFSLSLFTHDFFFGGRTTFMQLPNCGVND